MKPRHYSPSLECKEENEDRTDLQEEISVLESSSTPGSRVARLPLNLNSTGRKGDGKLFSKSVQNVFDS